jgi:hypothetical protein
MIMDKSIPISSRYMKVDNSRVSGNLQVMCLDAIYRHLKAMEFPANTHTLQTQRQATYEPGD